MSVSFTDFGLALAAGSLTALSPCVLPMIPLVVGGAMQSNRYAPLFIALGMILSFALLGVVMGTVGASLGLHASTLRNAGAWLLLIFGVVMLVPRLNAGLTQWLSPIANSASQASAGIEGRSFGGAFLLGAVLGMVWTPCSGPLLGSTLTLVASEGSALSGGILLAFFGLGAALPLVGLSFASRAGFNALRDRLLPHMDALRRVFALLLVLIGFGILSGLDKKLESEILDAMPEWWINMTVSV